MFGPLRERISGAVEKLEGLLVGSSPRYCIDG